MILSHRHRFLFIKGAKVAGTSVELALSPICGPDDILTPLGPRDERARLASGSFCRNWGADPAAVAAWRGRLEAAGNAPPGEPPPGAFFNHIGLAAVLAKTGIDLDRYLSFAVERSPYAKILSLVNFQVARDRYQAGEPLQADLAEVKAAIGPAIDSGAIRMVYNIGNYRTKDGSLGVRVLRQDSLAADLAALLGPRGIRLPAVLPIAKQGWRFDRCDPRDFFTVAEMAEINRQFADEFAAFGYPRL